MLSTSNDAATPVVNIFDAVNTLSQTEPYFSFPLSLCAFVGNFGQNVVKSGVGGLQTLSSLVNTYPCKYAYANFYVKNYDYGLSSFI